MGVRLFGNISDLMTNRKSDIDMNFTMVIWKNSRHDFIIIHQAGGQLISQE